MLKSLLDTPAAYYDHIRRYTTSLTTSMDYGFRLVSMEDPRAKQLFDVSQFNPDTHNAKLTSNLYRDS